MKRLLALALSLVFAVACQTPAPPPPPAPEPVAEVAPPPPPPPPPAPSFRVKAPDPLPERPYRFPEVTRVTLDNGLRVLVAENHDSPLVAMRVLVRSGAIHDPADHAGLASVTADMLDEGAGKRNALQFAEEVANLGMEINTAADWDGTYIRLQTLGRNAAAAVDLLADVTMRPRFDAADFSRVKKERLTTLLQQKDSAPVVAANRFTGFVYPGTPYGNPLQGTEASVGNIDRNDLRSFYKRHYAPNNAVVIVAGDVRPDDAVDMVKRAFGSWKRGAAVPEIAVNPAAVDSSRIYVVDRPQAVQSEIRVGHAGIARTSEDYFPVLVMNTVLGGISSARIYQNLREKHGYTYSASSQFAYRRGPGPFVVATPVRNDVTTASIKEILSELRRIRTGDISDVELQRAKSNRAGLFPATVEGAQNIAQRLEDMEVFRLPDDYWDTYRERIAAVTKDDVVRAANKYIDPDKSIILVVGKASDVRTQLAELGMDVAVVDVEGRAVAQ